MSHAKNADLVLIKEDGQVQKSLHVRTTVLPGGKVEFASLELEAGQTVDVVVTRSSSTERRSVVDILAEAPGGLVFKTAADVAAYLKEEKESWGH